MGLHVHIYMHVCVCVILFVFVCLFVFVHTREESNHTFQNSVKIDTDTEQYTIYHNYPFFRSGNMFRWHSAENLLLEYRSTTKKYLHRSIFSHGYLEREHKHMVRTAACGGKASPGLQQ